MGLPFWWAFSSQGARSGKLRPYGMIMAAVALLAVFAQLGLPQLVTREVSTAVVTADLQALKAILVWFGLLVLATSSILLLIIASILMVLPSIEASVRSATVWGFWLPCL